jgi:hypothetical protein
MQSGDCPGLQNRRAAGHPVAGAFDSHTLPPFIVNELEAVIRGGFGIFTMTNLGQLSFNPTNIHVSVVRTTGDSVQNGQPAYEFPSVRTADDPLIIAGTSVIHPDKCSTVKLRTMHRSRL